MKKTSVISRAAISGCFLVVLLALFVAGCARDDRPLFTLEERQQASSPEPPAVLSVPVLTLLTNQAGFGAHCRIDFSPGTTRKPLEGELLHRENLFLFAPRAQDKRARGREMTFIWDTAAGEGRALNDALPGFAPMQSRARATAVQSTGKAPANEKIDGHPCTVEKVTITLSDGTESQLSVWRADDLRSMPMRIRSEVGAARFTIDLTEVRLQEPAARLFETPADFTRYETPKAMFDEMFRRESLAKRDHKTRSSFDEEEFQRTGRMRPTE